MRDERRGPLGDPRYVGDADSIRTTATHALDVVSRLIEARSIDSTPKNDALDAAMLSSIIDHTVAMMAPAAEDAGVRLSVADMPASFEVSADPSSLMQVLTNFLANAIKFSPPGQAVVVRVAITGAGQVELRVEDNGVGIAPRELKRLSGGNGEGLGLRLSRQAAATFQAEIKLESARGRGTTARLLFRAQTREAGGAAYASPQ